MHNDIKIFLSAPGLDLSQRRRLLMQDNKQTLELKKFSITQKQQLIRLTAKVKTRKKNLRSGQKSQNKDKLALREVGTDTGEVRKRRGRCNRSGQSR